MKSRVVVLSLIGIIIGSLLVLSSLPRSGVDIRYGLAEANFRLARDSRLPRWIRLPPGVERSDVLVEFVHFIHTAKVVATNKKTGRTFFAYHSANLRPHPITEQKLKTMSRGSPCPWYNIVSINGIEEVIEHVEQGNRVRVVENSDVTEDVYRDVEKRRRCEITLFDSGDP